MNLMSREAHNPALTRPAYHSVGHVGISQLVYSLEGRVLLPSTSTGVLSHSKHFLVLLFKKTVHEAHISYTETLCFHRLLQVLSFFLIMGIESSPG